MAQQRTRYDRFPFSTLFLFTVIKAFEMHGAKLRAGDVIDRDDVKDERLLRKLYDGHFLEVWADPEGDPIIIGTPAAAAKPPRQPAPKEEAKPTHALESEAADEAAIGGGLEARHEGFGKWFVYAGDVKVSGPHSKAEAHKKAGVELAA